MFGRLIVLIVGVGICIAALLAARQVRLQAAHELAETRRRIVRLDEELWRLRATIAARVVPDRVSQEAAQRLSLRPVIEPVVDPNAKDAASRLARTPGKPNE